jgi:EAL domain-containing protein (putative c-di-GMP-specific phosphodiesterase class I)
MGELTEVVILESIKAYKQIRKVGVDVHLSINLSAQNINNLALASIKVHILNQYKTWQTKPFN